MLSVLWYVMFITHYPGILSLHLKVFQLLMGQNITGHIRSLLPTWSVPARCNSYCMALYSKCVHAQWAWLWVLLPLPSLTWGIMDRHLRMKLVPRELNTTLVDIGKPSVGRKMGAFDKRQAARSSLTCQQSPRLRVSLWNNTSQMGQVHFCLLCHGLG